MNNTPLVSIVIPCRNEKIYISKCLDSIIASGYPKELLEVLVVDGMSEDGTRNIVEIYTQRYPFIRLLDNPKKNTPSALNIGIKNAIGEIIVRLDAHSTYPANYISTCVKYLESMPVDVVGGPVITKPGANTLIARSIALATSHPFGVGNSKFRTSIQEGYVDTVPFGAYWRTLFDKIGLFDEQLVRNQDNELSSRIIKNGGKIYSTPELTAYYYNQATMSGFLKQAIKTGMWNVLTIKINPAAFRWRHFIPFIFLTVLLMLGFLAPHHTGAKLAFLALIGLYSCAAGASAFQIGLKSSMIYFIILPFIFFLYHVSYGLGTWVGLFRMVFTKWKI